MTERAVVIILTIILAGFILTTLFIDHARPGSATGIASTYGWGKGRGDSPSQRVACGGRLNPKAMTAAHRSLRCGTRVTVTTASGRTVTVTITDRGPFTRGRIIDLSPAAARALGFGYGLGKVRVTW